MSSGRVHCMWGLQTIWYLWGESAIGIVVFAEASADDCIAGVSTDWEDTAKVIFSKIRQETNFGVGHNPESTKTDPWTSSSVENRIHRQMRGKKLIKTVNELWKDCLRRLFSVFVWIKSVIFESWIPLNTTLWEIWIRCCGVPIRRWDESCVHQSTLLDMDVQYLLKSIHSWPSWWNPLLVVSMIHG